LKFFLQKCSRPGTRRTWSRMAAMGCGEVLDPAQGACNAFAPAIETMTICWVRVAHCIWNRDQMYKNRVFSMYRFIPVHTSTYWYVLIHTKYKRTYRSVPVCTISKSCMLDTHRGTDLVLKHHSIHGTHTEHRFQQSYLTKSFLRNILVSMVYTRMYRYVLSPYQNIPVEQHVLYLGKGGLY
jgi:hypothetical protein